MTLVCCVGSAIGSLRYAHVDCPSREELEQAALRTVGQSRDALKKFKQSGSKIRIVNSLLSNERSSSRSSRASTAQAATARAAPDEIAEDDDLDLEASEVASTGGKWAEVVGAWLATDTSARARLHSFQKKYADERGGSDASMWQPMASRVAGLEVELRKMQKRQGGLGCCCGRKQDPEPRSTERLRPAHSRRLSSERESSRRSARMLLP